MKKLLFILACTFILGSYTQISPQSPKQEIQPYVDFIRNQTTSAKDYILNLFRKYDIVIICERDHRDITQYDFYLSILKDPYFINYVGNVFTEVGVSTLNPRLNQFMHNDSLSDEQIEQELLYFQRNVSFWPLWEKYNYYYFLKNCYALNHGLPPDKKINFFPSDVPFRWNMIQNAEDLKTFWRAFIINDKKTLRDSVLAATIIATYDSIRIHSVRKKALIIMNNIHAFNDVFDPEGYHAGKFLFQKYKGIIANVFVNNYIAEKSSYFTIQRGKWDAAFKIAGITDLGFDLKNSPFGEDSFDYYPGKKNLSYQDVFTGMVFYKPLDEFKLVAGIPGLADKKFVKELIRRFNIQNQFQKRKITLSPEKLLHYCNEKRSIKLENLDKMKKEISFWIN